MKEEVQTTKAQSAPAILSQALVANGFIFTSGFIHATPDGNVIQGTVAEKVKQIMLNIEETLKAAHATLDDILKVTIYVTDIAILSELNAVYPTYFTKPYPVREAVCVSALPLGATIEMSVVAVKK